MRKSIIHLAVLTTTIVLGLMSGGAVIVLAR